MTLSRLPASECLSCTYVACRDEHVIIRGGTLVCMFVLQISSPVCNSGLTFIFVRDLC